VKNYLFSYIFTFFTILAWDISLRFRNETLLYHYSKAYWKWH